MNGNAFLRGIPSAVTSAVTSAAVRIARVARRYDWRRFAKIMLVVFLIAVLPALKATLDTLSVGSFTVDQARSIALRYLGAGAFAMLAALVAYFFDPTKRAELDGLARYDFRKLFKLLGGVFAAAALPALKASGAALVFSPFSTATPRDIGLALLRAVLQAGAAGGTALIATAVVYFVDPAKRAELLADEHQGADGPGAAAGLSAGVAGALLSMIEDEAARAAAEGIAGEVLRDRLVIGAKRVLTSERTEATGPDAPLPVALVDGVIERLDDIVPDAAGVEAAASIAARAKDVIASF